MQRFSIALVGLIVLAGCATPGRCRQPCRPACGAATQAVATQAVATQAVATPTPTKHVRWPEPPHEADWQHWYHHNAPDVENLKEAIYIGYEDPFRGLFIGG